MGHKYVKEEDTFSTSQNGTVPKPTAAEVSANKFLRADGSWASGGGGGGASNLSDLGDTNISSPSNGQVLKYNGTSSKWENANESGGGTVTDVTVGGTSVVNGQGVAVVPAITAVEANPQGSASTDLIKIKIGSTNYNIPSGGGGNTEFYHFSGQVWSSNAGTLRGRGSIDVTLTGGIARIDFDIQFTASGTDANEFVHGINASLLQSLESRLPAITPILGGWWNLVNYSSPSTDYGSMFEVDGSYPEWWKPARYYDSSNVNNHGAWAENNFSRGQRIVGVCFGTYS